MAIETNRQCLSRDIPDDVKRTVRQRCGFGCVKCGRLFCQYHHFNPEFHEADEHNSNGITLLCPNHHSDCSSGRIDNVSIAQYDANPYCVKNKRAQYLLEDVVFPLEVVLGSIVFITEDGVLLKVDGESVISITPPTVEQPAFFNGRFSLGDGEDLIIKENEIITGVNSWDIDSSGKSVVIKKQARQIVIELIFEPPRRLFFRTVKLNYGGNLIESQYEGKILLKTLSGAMVDLPIGELVLGGQMLLDSKAGIQFTDGMRFFGLNGGMKFKMDLDSLFEEVRGMSAK